MGQRPRRGKWPMLPHRGDLSLISQSERSARRSGGPATRFESLWGQIDSQEGSQRVWEAAWRIWGPARGSGRPARGSGGSSWGEAQPEKEKQQVQSQTHVISCLLSISCSTCTVVFLPNSGDIKSETEFFWLIIVYIILNITSRSNVSNSHQLPCSIWVLSLFFKEEAKKPHLCVLLGRDYVRNWLWKKSELTPSLYSAQR